jgi:UDP-N-acetylmuramyl pentapeptide phosphotransferase/UDP-N-acetylglucosamine-1-phosphate transferase
MKKIFFFHWYLPSAYWGILLIVISAIATAVTIHILFPFFRRHALACPTARSSHLVPTPQGGGFAIISVTIGFFLLYFISFYPELLLPPILSVIGASLGLLILGGIDDIRPLPAQLRFLIQFSFVILIIWFLPEETRLLNNTIPNEIEKLIITLGIVWFVNLVNFMDGIDLITTVEMLPVWTVVLFFSDDSQNLPLMFISLCIVGSLIGFLPYNWPVARLFMGDIGSLPLGLLTGWALLQLAYQTSLILALIPALYYIADATLTLIKRLINGEKIWEAHRSHFYQRAFENERNVLIVISKILIANIILLIITCSTIILRKLYNPLIVDLVALSAACLIVNNLLSRLGQKQKIDQLG